MNFLLVLRLCVDRSRFRPHGERAEQGALLRVTRIPFVIALSRAFLPSTHTHIHSFRTSARHGGSAHLSKARRKVGEDY